MIILVPLNFSESWSFSSPCGCHPVHCPYYFIILSVLAIWLSLSSKLLILFLYFNSSLYSVVSFLHFSVLLSAISLFRVSRYMRNIWNLLYPRYLLLLLLLLLWLLLWLLKQQRTRLQVHRHRHRHQLFLAQHHQQV